MPLHSKWNGSDGLDILDDGNIIGGTTTAERNVISGNNASGIFASAGSNNTIQGNYLGLNSLGTGDIGNGSHGLQIRTADNQIGGSNPDEGNVISGNGSTGITIASAGADGTQIQGNLIGTDASGSFAVRNTGISGIHIIEGATNSVIGGTNAEDRNVIA